VFEQPLKARQLHKAHEDDAKLSMNGLGISSEASGSGEINITDQLLTRFSPFIRYWRKYGSTMRQYIS
jgi:hypothetical protein